MWTTLSPTEPSEGQGALMMAESIASLYVIVRFRLKAEATLGA